MRQSVASKSLLPRREQWSHPTPLSGSLPRHAVGPFLRNPLGRTFELGWLQSLRRLPKTLQLIVAACLFCEYVDHEIYVVEEHPLRLAVTLNVRGIKTLAFKTEFYLVGDRLDLPRIDAAAYHEIVRECARTLFEFEEGEFFSFLVLAGGDRFGDLTLGVGFLHGQDHSAFCDCKRDRQDRSSGRGRSGENQQIGAPTCGRVR